MAEKLRRNKTRHARARLLYILLLLLLSPRPPELRRVPLLCPPEMSPPLRRRSTKADYRVPVVRGRIRKADAMFEKPFEKKKNPHHIIRVLMRARRTKTYSSRAAGAQSERKKNNNNNNMCISRLTGRVTIRGETLANGGANNIRYYNTT